MRTLAMYLPQFHSIPENDSWWGKGFTEWTAVKSAKPLYKGHNQPRVPLRENYYDLSQKETMKWQAELMHNYGIDGMCIYHYWFENGRKLLEKPAENLLKWKDINMPFCFCWANDSWARTWSILGEHNVNTWCDLLEPSKESENNENDNGVLVKQSYGGRKEWIEHFQYLLPFFLDSRYIRVDDKPLIVIYKVSEIKCIREMIDCWRELAEEHGLSGLYVIGGGLETDVSDCLDGVYYRCPTDICYLWEETDIEGEKIQFAQYEKVWNEILQMAPKHKAKPYFMGMVGYDSSPRKGIKAPITEEGSADEFQEFLYKLFLKNQAYGNDITFINAWNEWGEGMYLEPDETHRYAFLQAVKNAKTNIISVTQNDLLSSSTNELEKLSRVYVECKNSFEKNKVELQKEKIIKREVSQWINAYGGLKNMGNFLFPYELVPKGSNIIIYGAGKCGRSFLKQICDNHYCNVVAVVDKNYKNIQKVYGIDVVSINDIYSIKHDFVVVAVGPLIIDEVVDSIYESIGKTDKLVYKKYEPLYIDTEESIVVRNLFNILEIKEPSYFDLGACHPHKASNTMSFYWNGSRGVNVEPNIYLKDEFDKYRHNDINLFVGVGRQHGEMTFFISKDMYCSTFSEEFANMIHKEKGIEYIEKKPIEIMTINEISEKYWNGVFPDFIDVDCEGMDVEILDHADFSNSSPLIICAEGYIGSLNSVLLEKKCQGDGYRPYYRGLGNVIYLRNDVYNKILFLN